MNLFCRLFGHRLPEYLRINRVVTYEGTAADSGAHDYSVQQPCRRCGGHFVVGYVCARGVFPPPDLT